MARLLEARAMDLEREAGRTRQFPPATQHVRHIVAPMRPQKHLFLSFQRTPHSKPPALCKPLSQLVSPEASGTLTPKRRTELPAHRRPSPKVIPLPPFRALRPTNRSTGWLGSRFRAFITRLSEAMLVES